MRSLLIVFLMIALMFSADAQKTSAAVHLQGHGQQHRAVGDGQ